MLVTDLHSLYHDQPSVIRNEHMDALVKLVVWVNTLDESHSSEVATEEKKRVIALEISDWLQGGFE